MIRLGTPATIPVTGRWWRHIPAGADPLYKPSTPADSRWQRGSVVDAFYLSDERDTAIAEWYRTIARAKLAPSAVVPFDVVSFEVDIDEVADLTTVEQLESVRLSYPKVATDFPAFQAVGEKLFQLGFRALIAPTDARPGNTVLCIFRPNGDIDGASLIAGVDRVVEVPQVPIGLRT